MAKVTQMKNSTTPTAEPKPTRIRVMPK